jgi:hypothetical protein
MSFLCGRLYIKNCTSLLLFLYQLAHTGHIRILFKLNANFLPSVSPFACKHNSQSFIPVLCLTFTNPHLLSFEGSLFEFNSNLLEDNSFYNHVHGIQSHVLKCTFLM